MKEVGKVKVFKVSEYQRKDGTYGCRLQAFTEDKDVVVFYRPKEEAPVDGSVYSMCLDVDNRFTAVIRYVKA